jgi:AbrB family looped-hinge helix DNA binding protein
MGTTDDGAESREDYGTAEINDRGRLTIPKQLREDLQIAGGTEFEVVREGGDIRLIRRVPGLETLTRGGD